MALALESHVEILAYIAGARDLGLTHRRGSSGDGLPACADSSFASKIEDRKFVLGGAGLYVGTAVMWLSRTQRCVTVSSTKAEYVAIGACAKEGLILRGVLRFVRPTTYMM